MIATEQTVPFAQPVQPRSGACTPTAAAGSSWLGRFGFVSMSGDGRRLACAVLHQEPDIWLVSNFDAAR